MLFLSTSSAFHPVVLSGMVQYLNHGMLDELVILGPLITNDGLPVRIALILRIIKPIAEVKWMSSILTSTSIFFDIFDFYTFTSINF